MSDHILLSGDFNITAPFPYGLGGRPFYMGLVAYHFIWAWWQTILYGLGGIPFYMGLAAYHFIWAWWHTILYGLGGIPFLQYSLVQPIFIMGM